MILKTKAVGAWLSSVLAAVPFVGGWRRCGGGEGSKHKQALPRLSICRLNFILYSTTLHI